MLINFVLNSKYNYISLIFLMLPAYFSSITLDVTYFGAKGNGVADDTKAFQKCIDKLRDNGGGTMLIPKGNYPISFLKFFGKKYSNITIQGDNTNILQLISGKRKSVENNKFHTFAERHASDGCFVFDARISTQTNDFNSIKNIKISGLNFISDVRKHGFDELLHQISAHGVSNFIVENCTFTGFLGDGIAINGGTDFAKFHDAYNKDVVIRNCSFDGINKNNRQGISIYYSDGFLIDRCSFKNTTRDDMPGAIDIEPDRGINVVRNGVISNCTFYNIGGMGAINVVLKESSSENRFSQRGFLIENCKFTIVTSPLTIISRDKTYSEEEKMPILTFRNSIVQKARTPFQIVNGNNILLKNIIFENIQRPVYRPVLAQNSHSIKIQGCNFKNLYGVDDLVFYGEARNIRLTSTIFGGKKEQNISYELIKKTDKFLKVSFYHFALTHYRTYLASLFLGVLLAYLFLKKRRK